MAKSTGPIRFKAKLLRPATPKGASWTFFVLPADASGQLPTRAMVSVEGTLGDAPFQATLEPDGQGSHWLKVPKALCEAAGVEAAKEVPEIHRRHIDPLIGAVEAIGFQPVTVDQRRAGMLDRMADDEGLRHEFLS